MTTGDLVTREVATGEYKRYSDYRWSSAYTAGEVVTTGEVVIMLPGDGMTGTGRCFGDLRQCGV